MKRGLFISMVVAMTLAISCDEVEPESNDDETYPVGVALRASFGTAEESCPEGLKCAEWCTVMSDGTELGTGLTCCVSPEFVNASTEPDAFAQCLNNLRPE